MSSYRSAAPPLAGSTSSSKLTWCISGSTPKGVSNFLKMAKWKILISSLGSSANQDQLLWENLNSHRNSHLIVLLTGLHFLYIMYLNHNESESGSWPLSHAFLSLSLSLCLSLSLSLFVPRTSILSLALHCLTQHKEKSTKTRLVPLLFWWLHLDCDSLLCWP